MSSRQDIGNYFYCADLPDVIDVTNIILFRTVLPIFFS